MTSIALLLIFIEKIFFVHLKILPAGLYANRNLNHRQIYLYATGGALLSGDDITTLPANRLAILKKMVKAPGIAAEFDSDKFNYGWINNHSKKQLVVFVWNWEKKSKTFHIPIEKSCALINYFTGEKIGSFDKEIVLKDFAGDNVCVYDVK